MSRLALSVLALGLAAAPVQAQVAAASDTVKALAKKAGLSVKYDKIEGRTALQGDLWEVKSGAISGPAIRLRVSCLADGQIIDAARSVCMLAFSTRSAVDWAFTGDPSVTLLADDSIRVRLGEARNVDLSAAGDLRSQLVMVELPIADLERLAGAREIIGRIGRHEFKLGSWSRKELTALAAIVALAAPSPAP